MTVKHNTTLHMAAEEFQDDFPHAGVMGKPVLIMQPVRPAEDVRDVIRIHVRATIAFKIGLLKPRIVFTNQ